MEKLTPYLLSFGKRHYSENQLKIYCDPKDMETVAYAVYYGCVGFTSEGGVLTVKNLSDDNAPEIILADRM